MEDVVTIYFLNWEKFNPRRDLKHPWWFAFKSDFATNPNYFGFTNNERLVVVYLLCEANNQAGQGRTSIKIRTMSGQTSIRASIIKSTISKLILAGICTESVPTEQNRTEQNKTKEKILKKERGVFIKNESFSEGKSDVTSEELNHLFNKLQSSLKEVPK